MCRYDGTIPYHRNQRTLITVTIELTRLRSAIISIAEKDVGSLTSPLPFMRLAPTCLTLAMLTMTTAYLRIWARTRRTHFTPVTATAGLLQSLRTVAPVSGTKRRWGDYFKLAGALQRVGFCLARLQAKANAFDSLLIALPRWLHDPRLAFPLTS
jgi:hypothetical protein